MQLFNLGAREEHFHEVFVSFSELETCEEVHAVLLMPEDNVDALRPFLECLELVVLQFPSFRDGRAFTQARALREYLGFKKEIRVMGDILPDQAGFLKRCGVDTVVMPENHDDPAEWQAQLERFKHYYQPV